MWPPLMDGPARRVPAARPSFATLTPNRIPRQDEDGIGDTVCHSYLDLLWRVHVICNE